MKRKTKLKKSVLIIALFSIITAMAIYYRRKQKLEEIPFTGSDQTRGIRNNNPLNLRKTNIKWKHEIEGKDEDFETFETMMWGLRASLRNMRTHYKRGVNTINKLISVWAPSSENDTQAYVNFVVEKTGRPLHKGYEWKNEDIYPIVKSMALIESKYNLKKGLFDEAWDEI